MNQTYATQLRNPSSLDYITHNCNSFCGTRSVATCAEVDGKLVYRYLKLGCKAWDCPICGPKKAHKLRKAITARAIELELTRFLTLTLDPASIPPHTNGVKHIRTVWRKFRVYLKRKHGRSISFISVIEFHRSGVPHLHILTNRYISQAWISETWEALGGGRIVFIKRVVDLHRIAWYLSKYLTKDAILSAPWGTRRYSTSRDITLFEKRTHSEWWLVDYHISLLHSVARGDVFDEQYEEDSSLRFFASESDLEKLIVVI